MYHFAKNQIQKLLYTFIEIQNLIIFIVDNIFDKLSVLSYSANLFPLAPCQVGLTMAVDRLADKCPCISRVQAKRYYGMLTAS